MYNNNNKLNIITMIFNRQVLFQFTTIKRETALVDKEDKNPTIAPTLMKFQRGCHQVRQDVAIDVLLFVYLEDIAKRTPKRLF